MESNGWILETLRVGSDKYGDHWWYEVVDDDAEGVSIWFACPGDDDKHNALTLSYTDEVELIGQALLKIAKSRRERGAE